MVHGLFVAVIVIAVVLAILVIKWLVILALVAALCWLVVSLARHVL